MTTQQTAKILVIDDEISERMLVKEYLEEAGFRVWLSEDGKHGLRMATTTTPDRIIVDAMLPSIDGYSICTSLRQDPRTTDVPIILITASKEADAISRGLAAGATDFITKPVEWRFLANRVTHVLNRCRSIRELQTAQHEVKRATGEGNGPRKALEEQIQSIQAEAAEQIRKANETADLKVQEVTAAAEQRIRAHQAEAADQIRTAHALAERHVQETKAAAEECVREAQVEAADQVRKANAAAEARLQAALAAAEEGIRALQAHADERVRHANAAADAMLEAATRSHAHETETLKEASAAEVREARSVLSRTTRSFWSFFSALGGEQLNLVHAVLENLEFAVASLETAANPSEALEKLRRAGRHAKDLAGLTNNARTLAQHSTGGAVLRETEFSLSTLVDSTAQTVASACRDRRLSIKSARPAGPLSIRGDEARIKFCLLHLLANAIAFGVAGGTISLQAEHDSEGGVRISINDNGVGMPPAILDKLRTLLQEPANMITQKDGGVGFGVPIASMIAGLHGGRLEFASALGEGTTVSLVLPPERVRVPASGGRRTA
jgi:DNA-binding response OmpR family regulator